MSSVPPPHSIMVDVENHVLNLKDLKELPALVRTFKRQVFGRMRRILWKVIGRLGSLAVPCIKDVRDEKLRHQLAIELVTHLCKRLSHKNYSYSELDEIYHLPKVVVSATTFGIVEIVKVCLQLFPDLIWFHVNGVSILQVAIEHRQEKIFNLMNKITGRNKMLMVAESERNNILHLVAKKSPPSRLSSVSGSAFQMQREVQWFKEVEKLVHPVLRDERREGKTAWEIFTEEHKDLVEKAEKWMKDTSNSCMVVSTLIATVVFAAAFTVPGGNDSQNGIPILLKKKPFGVFFVVFAVADALALFSSITSLLMFLSILTSRFAEEDFLRSLPRRLIIGLASLFFAIATMMVAFGAALSIVLYNKWKRVYIPITLLASFPVIMFVTLQFPLFYQMMQSTCGFGIFRPQRIW